MIAFAYAKEEPFSIGLGVLSPSYSQTVGKENVKVNVEQKDNGQFSYSVGDPKSGTNAYLNFGGSAASQPVNPSGFSDASPSGYAAPSPSAYGSSLGTAPYTGSGLGSSAGYTGSALGSSGYGGSGLGSSGYTGSEVGSSGYTGSGLGSSSGYAAPQEGAYTGFAGYQSPSYGASSGLGASGFGAGNTYGGSSGFGSLNAYGGSSGYGGQYNSPAVAPISPSAYSTESARKPEENSAQILPAGFSYHGTEGQAFLRQGNSPNFVISNEHQESARGPAEQSFYDNFKVNQAQGSGKVLVNGLVGYGPGGPRGNLPVGGFAGPQHAGLVREHGGHA